MTEEKLFQLFCEVARMVKDGSPGEIRYRQGNDQEILIHVEFKKAQCLRLVGSNPSPCDSHHQKESPSGS